MESTGTTAIIYIPPGISDDGHAATDCITHLQRRRYRLAAILRDLDLVHWALEVGRASRVVVDRGEHLSGELPVPVEVVGEITRRLVVQADKELPVRPPAQRLDLRKIFAALIVATVAAALIWVGLQIAQLGAVEVPLYALVGLVLAAWVPMAGIGIEAAWVSDIHIALASAANLAYRDGYADGFIDAATMDDF